MKNAPKETNRVHVTIPEEARVIFNWLLKYDPRFQGATPSAVAAELILAGTQALYAQSLQEAEPLDENVQQALIEQSLDAAKKAAS